MGKGSKCRPRQVSRKQFEKNWDSAFKVKKKNDPKQHKSR